MRTYCLHLILLISAFVMPLSESKGEELPTDTLLAHLYDQAASLMGEGEYDSAQACFDKAFATEGVTGSPLIRFCSTSKPPCSSIKANSPARWR